MKKHWRGVVFLAAILLALGAIGALRSCPDAPPPTRLPLIPLPVSAQITNGWFRVSPSTRLAVTDDAQRENAVLFNVEFKRLYGYALRVEPAKDWRRANTIYLSSAPPADLPALAYRLKVDSERITIDGCATSVWHGLQTLRQLLPPQRAWALRVPCVSIDDYPRFAWRGMHLDVSRHFFDTEHIKRYIDYLALYKMNVFHWHLTDDQGWRVEIKRYPKLTGIGATRLGTLVGHSRQEEADRTFTAKPHTGFYTQDEIRDVVAYAQARKITVVPEIEMPGHCLAALAAYPELSCTGGPFAVAQSWGKFEEAFCNKDAVFEFLENVLDEIVDLFPGETIHVGGDECSTKRWAQCPECEAVRSREGIADARGLQRYFMTRIEQMLNDRGRRMIGWCELVDSGLPPRTAVMSWRGMNGGITATKLGHPVVMTPTSDCYFDFYQDHVLREPLAIGGFTPLHRVYRFDPVPAGLTPTEQALVLGSQGNVWTEYIPTWDVLEYMVFPRIGAMAEVLWTPLARKDLIDFGHRLATHFQLLDRYGIQYCETLFQVRMDSGPVEGGAGHRVTLSNTFFKHPIRYTLDGTRPKSSSPRYKGTLIVPVGTHLRASLFTGTKARGHGLNHTFVAPALSGSGRRGEPEHLNAMGAE